MSSTASTKMFVMENSREVPIREHYSLEKKPMSMGRDSSISRGTHRSTGVVHAVKSTKKRAQNIERQKQELAIMMVMDHPNIVKLVETFEDQRSVHRVMELCSGGLLIDRIVEAGQFSEVEAAIIMKQILGAVFYMHENGVCHRDLTVDKFMFLSKAPIKDSILKLVDLEYACSFQQGSPLSERIESSSLSSYAPEFVWEQGCGGRAPGAYDEKCDLWSCGTILFILLCGRPPCSGSTPKEILDKGRRADFDFNAKCWDKVSDEGKHLVLKLLKAKPHERFSAEQALNNAWVTERAPKATSSLNLDFLQDLKSLQSAARLKKVALQVMVGQFTQDEIGSLREVFNTLDSNGDGMLTVEEMRDGLSQAGLTEIPADLQQAIENIDLDGNDRIDYSEFLSAALEKKHYMQEDACWKAFNFFDRDGDGTISLEELRQALNSGRLEHEVSEEIVEQALREVDQNGDGLIDFQEFMHMMKSSS